jgi:hypothetical protein
MQKHIALAVLLGASMLSVSAQTKIPKIESGAKIFIAPMGGFAGHRSYLKIAATPSWRLEFFLASASYAAG